MSANQDMQRSLAAGLTGKQDIRISSDTRAAVETVRCGLCSLVLFDFDFVVSEGFGFLRALVWANHAVPVVVVSRLSNSNFIARAVQIGAAGFIDYPCSPQYLQRKIEQALSGRKYAEGGTASPKGFEQLTGGSRVMVKLKETLSRFSRSDCPVLLLGESGTGKSVASRLIHRNSGRKNAGYCSVNVAAVPEPLTESELFGTCPGAYTGAVMRAGYFEQACGGTLFLDEIGEMSLAMQAKILDVIETGTYRRLGSGAVCRSDVRLVTATHRDLYGLMRAGLFRDDLFYRIAVLVAEIPPLCARQEDIPRLAAGFLRPSEKLLSAAAADKLAMYSWPGNVRQLQNCLLRAAALCDDDVIFPEHIFFVDELMVKKRDPCLS